MTAVTVITGILLLILLIGQIRVGGEAEYSHTGVTVSLRFWFFHITVYPQKKKTEEKTNEKKKKESSNKSEEQKTAKMKRGGTLALLKELLPVALEAVGKLKRKIRIDQLILHLTWAADDPASAAMGYGAANAAMGMIYPVLDQNFKIKKSDVGIDLDFGRSEPEIYVDAELTLTLGQLVCLIFHYGIKVVLIYTKQRGKQPHNTVKKEALTDERTETPNQ